MMKFITASLNQKHFLEMHEQNAHHTIELIKQKIIELIEKDPKKAAFILSAWINQ